MSKRVLHIVAYDVPDPKRLVCLLGIVKDYATGGQKSAYECFLHNQEKAELIKRISRNVKRKEDLVCIVRLNNVGTPRILGIAEKPQDPNFYFIG